MANEPLFKRLSEKIKISYSGSDPANNRRFDLLAIQTNKAAKSYYNAITGYYYAHSKRQVTNIYWAFNYYLWSINLQSTDKINVRFTGKISFAEFLYNITPTRFNELSVLPDPDMLNGRDTTMLMTRFEEKRKELCSLYEDLYQTVDFESVKKLIPSTKEARRFHWVYLDREDDTAEVVAKPKTAAMVIKLKFKIKSEKTE